MSTQSSGGTVPPPPVPKSAPPSPVPTPKNVEAPQPPTAKVPPPATPQEGSSSKCSACDGLGTQRSDLALRCSACQGSGYTQGVSRFRNLCAAEKGNVQFNPSETFMLHVHWEAPSLAAADALLDGLEQCAAATHRDTPCAPIYFFRVSDNDSHRASSAVTSHPGDHAAVQQARKRLKVGVPRPSVLHILSAAFKDRVSVETLNKLLDSEDTTALPDALQTQPVRVEFTEVYLDVRAFWEHSASPLYQKGYASVMDPGNLLGKPLTLRIGTPTQQVVDSVLEPMLNEMVMPLKGRHAVLWRPPVNSQGDAGEEKDIHKTAVFLSLELNLPCGDGTTPVDTLGDNLPLDFSSRIMMWVVYPHPDDAAVTSESASVGVDNEGTVSGSPCAATRVMCVLCNLPSLETLHEVQSLLKPTKTEAHTFSDRGDAETLAPSQKKYATSVHDILHEAGFAGATVNHGRSVGYFCHKMVASLRPTSPP